MKNIHLPETDPLPEETIGDEDLTSLAYNGIQSLLFKNLIQPGQRLNSRGLAKTLGMSPTPVTQALKLLEFRGLLDHVPNKGYFLGKNSRQMVRDIFSLRLAIETSIIDTILERIDDAGWKKLDEILESHMEALELNDSSRILVADMTFHMAMANITTGVVGERMIRYLFELLYLKNRSAIMQTSPRKKFGIHHKEILTFLKKGDVESAREALSEHITQVRDDLLRSIDQEED